MLHRLFQLISNLNLMKNDDWREQIKERNKTKAKIVGVMFAVVLVLCLLIRIFA